MDIAEFKRDLFAVTCDMQRMLHDTMVPVCQQRDLTLQQFHVLLELTRTPGLTAGEASDRAGILRTNFSAVCHKLETRGLVERRRSAVDKRAFELQLTEAGRALLLDVDAEVRRRYGSAFESESPETFETIIAGFRALNAFTAKLRG